LVAKRCITFYHIYEFELKDEIKTSTSFDNLMEKDANVVMKLTCLASNIKMEACGGFCIIFSNKI
jgi:hypothetical protein